MAGPHKILEPLPVGNRADGVITRTPSSTAAHDAERGTSPAAKQHALKHFRLSRLHPSPHMYTPCKGNHPAPHCQ